MTHDRNLSSEANAHSGAGADVDQITYSQGRLSNRSLISGGQMQIITQCLLSLPPYSAL